MDGCMNGWEDDWLDEGLDGFFPSECAVLSCPFAHPMEPGGLHMVACKPGFPTFAGFSVVGF